MNSSPLLPLTKLVLAVSAAVQALMALAGFAAPGFTGNILSPYPQPPTIAIYYVAGFYLAGAVCALVALRQDVWASARAYLASAFVLIAAFLVITVAGLLVPPGLQPVSWLYVALSVLYLPTVAWTWRAESARAGGENRLASSLPGRA